MAVKELQEKDAYILASAHILTKEFPENWESFQFDELQDYCETYKSRHFKSIDREDEENAYHSIAMIAEDLMRASHGVTRKDWYDWEF